MCGILGSVFCKTQISSQTLFSEALMSMSRRGPDDHRIENLGPVVLGHNRLAVIDVDQGQQPMSTADGRYWIVFNGEVYNHRELRLKLTSEGVRFRTRSDTEVILKCFALYGENCVDHLNGMFAFAIYDTEAKQLFLARDRVGVKPLFLFADGRSFSFSSSIVALRLLHKQDTSIPLVRSISSVVRFQASLGLKTVYENIFRFPAASTMTIKVSEIDNWAFRRYWYPDRIDQADISIREAQDQIQGLVDDAVRIRMVSERPIGSYLSGGVDSAIIAASASNQASGRLKTFTVGFPGLDLDESLRAREVAKFLDTDHTEILVEDDKALVDLVENLLEWIDEPFADPSLIPSAICAREAAQQLTVVLTGDGPDELWGGYNSFKHANTLALLDKLHLRKPFMWGRQLETLFNRCRGKTSVFPRTRLDEVLVAGGDETLLFQRTSDSTYLQLVQPRLSAVSRTDVLSSTIVPNPNWDHFTRFSFMQMQIYQQQVVIPKVDYSTMYSSLEGRSPFLDYRFVEATLALPARFKFGNGKSKILLKESFAHRLPVGCLDLPKKYFTPPLDQWLRGPLKNWMLDQIFSEASGRLFNLKEVSIFTREHFQGKSHGSILWAICCISAWLNRNQFALDYGE